MSENIEKFCLGCHDTELKKGNLDLESIGHEDLNQHLDVWERVARKLKSRQMPPIGKARPDEHSYEAIISRLSSSLDHEASKHPNPGRTDTLRRLNRTEYQNAIRDLLALEIDASTLLPKDESSHGFDNVTVGDLSPMLLERYISAAQKISRLAVGAPQRTPGGDTIRIRPDVTQEEHVEGLPPGTRGGALIPYTFPRDGDYEIQIRLTRDRNEEVEGLRESHELEILLDRERLKSFTVVPPKGNKNYDAVDAHLKARIPVIAGPHQLGVTFVKNPSELLETKRQPYHAHYNTHRHPRLTPAIYQVSINGPYDSGSAGVPPAETGQTPRPPVIEAQDRLQGGRNFSLSHPMGEGRGEGSFETPSHRRIFICHPKSQAEEEPCAQRILSNLMRRAYRRPITSADLGKPMAFYRNASTESFEAGIEAALAAILVGPEFLFRVEQDPTGISPNTAYPINDLALASRLSFFLWSSIPDEELLESAIRGELHRPKVLEKQTRRMLADSRSRNLVNNFAEQWLYLRNLESITPDLRLFPDFDDNLRQAFRQETELFFASIIREDRSVLDLLKANYTFLNGRLAAHYNIPHVYGSRFRRVDLQSAPNSLKVGQTSSHPLGEGRGEGSDATCSSEPAPIERGGLLRQGSVLTVTSYATRTSPVIRGKWVLDNLLGSPPPPPLPNVPALKDNTISATLSVRERLAEHRANAACASCHNLMDPVGFALENFDAIGRWRAVEDGKPVDTSGGFPDGSQFSGVAGLEDALRKRPELFVSALTEKLLTFALGRGIEYYDAPAVRKIVHDAQVKDYHFSAIVLGIVNSTPFTMRRSL